MRTLPTLLSAALSLCFFACGPETSADDVTALEHEDALQSPVAFGVWSQEFRWLNIKRDAVLYKFSLDQSKVSRVGELDCVGNKETVTSLDFDPQGKLVGTIHETNTLAYVKFFTLDKATGHCTITRTLTAAGYAPGYLRLAPKGTLDPTKAVMMYTTVKISGLNEYWDNELGTIDLATGQTTPIGIVDVAKPAEERSYFITIPEFAKNGELLGFMSRAPDYPGQKLFEVSPTNSQIIRETATWYPWQDWDFTGFMGLSAIGNKLYMVGYRQVGHFNASAMTHSDFKPIVATVDTNSGVVTELPSVSGVPAKGGFVALSHAR